MGTCGGDWMNLLFDNFSVPVAKYDPQVVEKFTGVNQSRRKKC